MSVQRRRLAEILAELKRRGAFCVVGGPWVSVEEGAFGGLADVVFVGEAEESWPRFLRDWEAGRHGRRYEQPERTDMTTVPVPRYDLLPMGRYLFGSVQFSRGCPFQCEFCDIIVTFGRRPRMKAGSQVVAELEALRRQGMAIAFVVDDNLIGNKAAIRAVLAEVAEWQRRHDYPLTLFSEASIDLADEPDLMRAMTEADFTSVFIGIETPNEESLRETRKVQNLRGGRSLVEKVHAIQAAGRSHGGGRPPPMPPGRRACSPDSWSAFAIRRSVAPTAAGCCGSCADGPTQAFGWSTRSSARSTSTTTAWRTAWPPTRVRP
jgi:radical SAM superfamily enzyme YgiQ (UPF0313 family)